MVKWESKIILAGLSLGLSLVVSCGKKKSLDPINIATSAKGAVGSADAKLSLACKTADKCKALQLVLRGTDAMLVNGSLGQVLSAKLSIIAQEAPNRKVKLRLMNPPTGMEKLSTDLDDFYAMYWKPTEVTSGTLNFRGRDITRCQVFYKRTDCNDMSADFPEDANIPITYRVTEKEEDVDADEEFFNQFICGARDNKIARAKAFKAATGLVLGGIKSIKPEKKEMTEEERKKYDALSLEEQKAYDKEAAETAAAIHEQQLAKAKGKVAVLVDYFRKGDPQKSAFECIQENAQKSKSEGETVTTVIQ